MRGLAIFFAVYWSALFIALFFGYEPTTYQIGIAYLQSSLAFVGIALEGAKD